MTPTLYTITAQTNLHAGSGDMNYGMIDKLVQRDTLTKLPCIFSHSLKGSLREYCEGIADINGVFMDKVFGKTNRSKELKPKTAIMGEEGKSGEYIFMQANLLSIPIRSDVQPFFRCTSHKILEDLCNMLQILDKIGKNHTIYEEINKLKTDKALILNKNLAKCHLEDQKDVALTAILSPELSKLLGEDTIILPDEKLQKLIDNHHLPVIARNHLENGQSTNLWYEQILPRQTKFTAIILSPSEGDSLKKVIEKAKLIQIGANATVGYGYCKFEAIQDFKKEIKLTPIVVKVQ
jgi:CRISPR-associated protein Cmr4